MTKIAGSDEAGRGSIIGSLFVAIVMTDEKGLETLKEMGARDSKMISPGVREQLAEKIKKITKWKVMRISPNKIDSRFINGTNLNWLEGKTMIELINEFKPDKAIVDSPSNNISKFKGFLKSHLETDTELVVEHKADANYPIVGAASILAKTERDKEMRDLSKKLNMALGSGYPSDPIAIKAVKMMIHTPLEKYIRRTWFTYSRIKGEKEQSKLEDFE